MRTRMQRTFRGLRRRAGSRRPGAGAGLSSFSVCSAVPFATGAGRGDCSFAVCTALVVRLPPWVAAGTPSEAAVLLTAFLPAGFGFKVGLALLVRFAGTAAAFSAGGLPHVAFRRVARSENSKLVTQPSEAGCLLATVCPVLIVSYLIFLISLRMIQH